MATSSTTRLRFRLLGPLEVLRDGEPLPLGGERQRGLLALLLLHANELVTTEHLAEQLFVDVSEASIGAVRVAVSRLRRLLDDETLATRPGGYLVRADPEQLDVTEFEELVAQGRAALGEGDPVAAAAAFSQAVGLFRGQPLADLALLDFVQLEIRRLEELRLSALMDRIDADLALGRGSELVAELETLVQANPFQERLRGQLMLALYRSGRQTEALEVYRRTRQLLADELGLEPSRALQQLERAILRHDDSLEPAAPAGAAQALGQRPRSRSRWRLAGAVCVLAACLGIAIAVVLSTGAAAPARPERRPAKILATFDLPQPSCCGFGFNAVWGLGHHDDTLRKIDPRTHRVLAQWPVAGFQSGVPLAAAGSVWIPSPADALVRFDPALGKVTARIRVQGPTVAFGFLTLWETTMSHQLDRIDLHTKKVVHQIRLAPGGNNWVDELAVGEGAVWVAVADEATLVRINPQTNEKVAFIRGFGSTDSGMPIALDANAVWVLRMVGGQETLFRLDPTTNRIVKRIAIGPPTGSAPTGTVTTGGGYVWTGNWNSTISKVDPRTNRVLATYTLPDNPQNVTYGDGSVWVDSYDASKVWRIDPNS
jgi:DNA-binding SARP family transcriptional activator/glutamine cyclotransferase